MEPYWRTIEKGDAHTIYSLGLEYQSGTGNVETNLPRAVVLFQAAAGKGSVDALQSLGTCYHKGKGVQKDEKKAFRLYQKAVDKGNIEAICSLGVCYYYGEGVKQDEKKAVRLYLEAVDKGNVEAIRCLGACYYNGKGVDNDDNKAVQWFQEAMDKGNVDAIRCLGVCYYSGRGVVNDDKKAVDWFREAIHQGNVEALHCLGVCYYTGRGVAKDQKKAVHLFQQARDKGNVEALRCLGVCYYFGKGVIKDLKKAVHLFREALVNGNTEAILGLKVYYVHRNNVDQKRDRHIHRYLEPDSEDQRFAREYEKQKLRFLSHEEAMHQGDRSAIYRLGLCYEYGIGVDTDKQKAAQLYEEAADQGHAGAMGHLGFCYQHGIGVDQDSKRAVSFYQRAMHQGDVDAIRYLGTCYEFGNGVHEDPKKALDLYEDAMEKGNQTSTYCVARFHGQGNWSETFLLDSLFSILLGELRKDNITVVVDMVKNLSPERTHVLKSWNKTQAMPFLQLEWFVSTFVERQDVQVFECMLLLRVLKDVLTEQSELQEWYRDVVQALKHVVANVGEISPEFTLRESMSDTMFRTFQDIIEFLAQRFLFECEVAEDETERKEKEGEKLARMRHAIATMGKVGGGKEE